MFHGRVHECGVQTRERHNSVIARANFGPAQAEDDAIEPDILASVQLGMESRADVQQRRDPTTRLHPSPSWTGDAGQQPQRGRLARTVAADQAQRLAPLQAEAQVTQGPQVLPLIATPEHVQKHTPRATALAEQIALTHAPEFDEDLR